MLTSEGRQALAEDTAARLDGGTVRIISGDRQAEAAIASVTVQDGRVTVEAEFGGSEANFDWQVRELVASDGTVIDRHEADMGRKAEGSMWAVDATLGFES